ncbi:hypothetical protein C0J52_03688 [Blattella germanica]|nr:hypothetical protein C0J52_03688 [Blattella germanica]
MGIDQKTVVTKPLRVKSGGIQKKAKEKKLKQKNLKKVANLLKKSDGVQKQTKEKKLKQKNLKVAMSPKKKYSSDQPLNSIKNNSDGNLLKKVAETGSLKVNKISVPKTLKKKKEVFNRKHQMPQLRFPSQIYDKQRASEKQPSRRNLKNEKQNHKKNYVQAPSIESPSKVRGKKKFTKFNTNQKNKNIEAQRTLSFRFPSVVKNNFDVKNLYHGIENIYFSRYSKSKLFVTNLPENIIWQDLKSAIPGGSYYKVNEETKSAVITFRNKNLVESIINEPKKHIIYGVEVNVSDSKPAMNGKSNNATRKKPRVIKSAPSMEDSSEDISDSDNEEDADEHSMSSDEVAEGDSDDDKSESDDDDDDDDDDDEDDKSESDNSEEAENIDSLNTSDGEGEENIEVGGSDSDNASSSIINDKNSSEDEEDEEDDD